MLDTEGGTRVVHAIDYPGGDAIGMTAGDGDSAGFFINGSPLDGTAGPTRLAMTVDQGGTASVELFDTDENPRLRFTITDSGAGAIQFLDAQGRVVQQIAPEDDTR